MSDEFDRMLNRCLWLVALAGVCLGLSIGRAIHAYAQYQSARAPVSVPVHCEQAGNEKRVTQ